MHYELTNTREEEVTVDGLGVLPSARRDEKSGELLPTVIKFDEESSQRFARDRGIQLTSAYLPEGVTGALVIPAEGEAQ